MPIFHSLGKQNYVQICMNAIDKECGEISSFMLQETCVNLSLCYHTGSNFCGYHYELRVIDEFMENINMWTESMLVSANEESWKNHSLNVIAANKGAVFEQTQYM